MTLAQMELHPLDCKTLIQQEFGVNLSLVSKNEEHLAGYNFDPRIRILKRILARK
jgi:hypothetical protein